MKKLTLNERIEVGCEEGLWRTYSECYTHSDLDSLKVPKFWEELTDQQRNFLLKGKKR